jgi:ribosome-associated protein YbcJ (S4-like RNA binding protein)
MSHAKTPIHQPGLVLTPGSEGWWDSERVSSPQVLYCADGTWKMWYYGRDASFDRQINLPTGRCGLAVSADGIDWQRVQGSLTMGAVFEPHPDPHRFDSAHVGVSNVYFHDGLYWMWYFGGDRTFVERKLILTSDNIIKLDQFLKLVGIASTGGQAKLMILDGDVKVNGTVEIRRGRKLVSSDKVTVEGRTFDVGDVIE